MTDDQSRKISIIIPTLNRGEFLENSLTDMVCQTYQNYEIIIVDQSDICVSLGVQQIIKNNSDKVKYIKVNFKGLPNARNYGFQKAEGDILIYIDDDIRCGPNFISEHVRTYKNPKIAMVAGGIDQVGLSSSEAKAGIFNYSFASAKRGFQSYNEQFVQHVPGGNFSIKKSIVCI